MRGYNEGIRSWFVYCKWKIAHQTVRSRILLNRSVKISCLQTELAAVLMEDFIHFLQAVVV